MYPSRCVSLRQYLCQAKTNDSQGRTRSIHSHSMSEWAKNFTSKWQRDLLPRTRRVKGEDTGEAERNMCLTDEFT